MRGLRQVSVAAVAATMMVSSHFAASAEEVKVGVVTSWAGPNAPYGVSLTNAVKLAIEKLEKDKFFGEDTVTVVYEDNRSDKHEAISLVTRLAQRDNVAMIIGPASSAEALAVAPVAVDLQIPIYTQGTTMDQLKAGDWVFKSPESSTVYMLGIADYVVQTLKPKSCFYVSIRDSEAYITQKNTLRDRLSQAGIATAGDDSILSTDTNFTALATKIAGSGADCIYVSAQPEVAANVIIQAKQAGLPQSTQIVGDPTSTSEAFWRVGGEAVNGAVAAAWFDPQGVNDLAREFIADYTAKYGSPPDTFAAQGYTVMMVTADAIKRSLPGVNRQKLRDALASAKDVTVPFGNGSYSFGPDRSPIYNSGVLKLKDGVWSRP